MTRQTKIINKTLVLILILLSSCLSTRKKQLVKLLTNVETEPKTFCTTLKTKISDNYISIKGQVGNRSDYQNFIFDTGSPLTYSFKTKDSFNIATKKYVKFGSYKCDYGSNSFNLGNVKFKNVGFLVTDHILEEYKGIDGLIGSSILQTSICELNFSDSTIKISNDLNNFTNIQNSYSSEFQPSEGQGTPIVKIAMGKDTITAFVDTGFEGLIKLNQNEKISLETASKKESFSNGRYFGGTDKDHFFYRAFYQVHRMGIFGMELDSMVVMQYPEYYGRNLVGMKFLEKFIITIDWIHHRIYLKPIQNIQFKKNIYTYGFTCLMREGELRVLQIYKGSEFEKAGIKSGDVITSINKTKDFTNAMVSDINSNSPNSDTIQIEIKNKLTLTLRKNKLFN